MVVVSEMTYTVSNGTLNSTIPYHTLTLALIRMAKILVLGLDAVMDILLLALQSESFLGLECLCIWHIMTKIPRCTGMMVSASSGNIYRHMVMALFTYHLSSVSNLNLIFWKLVVTFGLDVGPWTRATSPWPCHCRCNTLAYSMNFSTCILWHFQQYL